jgi:hypothetical protein
MPTPSRITSTYPLRIGVAAGGQMSQLLSFEVATLPPSGCALGR